MRLSELVSKPYTGYTAFGRRHLMILKLCYQREVWSDSPAVMPDSFHGRTIDRIKSIDNPVL